MRNETAKHFSGEIRAVFVAVYETIFSEIWCFV